MISVQTILGHLTSSVALIEDYTKFIFDKSASIIFSGAKAFYDLDGADHDIIVVKGDITGGSDALESAISLKGLETALVIAKSAEISANVGVESNGFYQTLTNHGRIDAGGIGIWARSNGTFINDGIIKSDGEGFLGGSHTVSVENRAHGQIISQGAAIEFQGDASNYSVLTNWGLIKSTQTYAVLSSDGNDSVVNHGTIKGMIAMGGGDDMVDTRDGKIDGIVYGGSGNDTLVTSNAHYTLSENAGAGNDTVESTVSYTLSANVETLMLLGKSDIDGKGSAESNTLTGNAGDNVLKGMAGLDVLNGNRGDDVLTGGADADIFIFAKQGGHDTITDFTIGVDEIDLSGQDVFDDYFDMIDNHVTSSHGNVVIHMGNDTLTLENTDLDDLDWKDFYFGVNP